MAKLNVTNALVASLKPLLAVLVTESGSIWSNTRDAYTLALREFPEAGDAASAIRQVLKDEMHTAAPGSIKGYLSTLQFLARSPDSKGGGAGLDADTIGKLNGGEAEAIRYPKALKLGEPGYMEQQAAKHAAKVAEAEASARAEAAKVAANPKLAAIKAITDILEMMSEDELHEVFELIGKPEQAAGTVAVEVAEREAA